MPQAQPPIAPRACPRPLFLLLLTLPQAGCGAGWRTSEPSPQTFEPRQQVQVWTAGKTWQFHGVRSTGDSVSGIHYLEPLTCDSCRVSLPRAAVDSIRLGDPAGGVLRSIGLAAGIGLGLVLVICGMSQPCQLGN